MSTHNLCFGKKYEKYQRFLFEFFKFLEVKFFIYLNRRVFVMTSILTVTFDKIYFHVILIDLIFMLLSTFSALLIYLCENESC